MSWSLIRGGVSKGEAKTIITNTKAGRDGGKEERRKGMKEREEGRVA